MSAARKLSVFVMALASVSMMGCAAATRLIDYGHMKTDVSMGETIFLSPSDKDVKKVYVDVRNTSKNQAITNDFRSIISDGIMSNGKGYLLANKPSEADYILQTNIRYEGEWKQGMNFEGTLTGASLGAVGGLGLSGWKSGSSAVGGALLGGAIGLLADVATRVKTEIIVVDVQISERLAEGDDIIEQNVHKTDITSKIKSDGGIGTRPVAPTATTSVKTVESGKKGVRIFNTAVAAKAMQVNMDSVEAAHVLIGIAGRQVAGIF